MCSSDQNNYGHYNNTKNKSNNNYSYNDNTIQKKNNNTHTNTHKEQQERKTHRRATAAKTTKCGLQTGNWPPHLARHHNDRETGSVTESHTKSGHPMEICSHVEGCDVDYIAYTS